MKALSDLSRSTSCDNRKINAEHAEDVAQSDNNISKDIGVLKGALGRLKKVDLGIHGRQGAEAIPSGWEQGWECSALLSTLSSQGQCIT